MAEDRIKFGIGFDLTNAVERAEKDFQGVLKDLQAVADKNPVSIDFDTKKIDTKKIEIARDSILGLQRALSNLGKEWDTMSSSAKFNESGELTKEAKELIEKYSKATTVLQQYGQSLKDITADIKEQAEAQLRYISNNETVNKAIEKRTIEIQKQRKTIEDLDKQFAQLNAQNKVYTADGTITNEAQELVDAYEKATASLKQYGITLEQIIRQNKQRAAEQLKEQQQQQKAYDDYWKRKEADDAKQAQADIAAADRQRKAQQQRIAQEQAAEDKRYQEWLRIKNQEAIDTERLEQQKQAATARTIAEQNKEYARQAAAERERQAAISASLRAEYQKIDLKRQAEAASKRELEMLNAQYRAEEARNRLARQDERIKQLSRLRGALQAEENSIANINAKLQIYRQRMQSAEINGRQFTQSAKQVERLSKKLEEANNRVAQLTGQTVSGQRRMTSAVEETNRAYSSTEGYISRLLRRTAVLFGIHQVTRFAERLREVTAEFELQRVSLGAIIQDQEKANAIFGQIKTFAVQSPFEIKDLVGYVKQLSAYKIETDKLFDTTKRLADVSAGLGTDMQRIILAYGQVKAASVLRGTEVRQFTEAGIPLIELLAEKFTALRGEMVSTGEVFDLISQRAVSFEMVAEIFEDMTNAGGMFYNMQEKQAATLAGQWSNLKDSLSIMYDEMGNTSGVRGAMEGMINLVKTLAENWQLVSGLMIQTLGGAAILGVINKFKSLWNMLGVQMFSATQKVAVAQERYNAVLGRYGALSKNATRLEREAIVVKYQAAKAALASAKATEAAAASTSRLAFAWKRFTMFLKTNWLSVVIGALITLYQVISHLVSKSNELENALADIKKEGGKNMEVMAQSFERLAKRAVEAADGSKEQREALEELQRTYKDMIPTHQLTIENLRKLEGKYSSLTDAVREYAEANIYAQKVEAVIANTQEKVLDLQSDIRDNLKGGLEYADMADGHQITSRIFFSDSEINQIFGRVKYYAQNTSDDIRTILTNAIGDVSKDMPKSALDSFLSLKKFKKIIEEYRKEGEKLKELKDNFYSAENLWGNYGKAIDKATDAINEWKNANKGLRGTSPFDFNKQLLKKSEQEYQIAIKEIIDSANKKLSDDKKIKIDNSWFSGEYIDTAAILKTLEKAGIDIESQAYKAVQKIQKAYSQFVPSNEFVKAINGKFEQIGRSMGDNVLNVINQDLMQSDESIDEFVKRFFNTIDSLKLQVKQKEALLKSGDVTGENRKAEEESLRRLKIRLAVYREMVPYVEQYRMQQELGGGGGDNTQLNLLKEEASLLQRVYKEYTELIKIQSQAASKSKIQDIYGKLLSSFGIDAAPTTFEGLMKGLDSVVKRMEKLPDSQKSVVELKATIGSLNTNEEKAKLEAELKRLADEVSRTKTAKEFFDKMLNLTGDQELSATVTMSVYGAKGDDLKRKIIDQIRNAFGTTTGEELDLSLAINYNTLEVDYLKLAQIAEENKGILLEKNKELRDGIIKNGLETTAARVMQWEKDIQTDQTYSEKRIRLAQETAARIADIEVQNIPESEKKRRKEGYQQREKAQAADLAWGAFKDSPMYVQMFDKLETASTTMLNAMLDKLKQLKSQWGKSLSPTELKELQSRMNEIEAQLANKNPFKTLASAIKEYRALAKGKSYNRVKRELIDNMGIADVESRKYIESLRLAQAAEQKYTEALKQHGDGSKEAKNARIVADGAWKQARSQQKIADNAKDAAEESQKTVDAYKKCADVVEGVAGAIGEWTGKLNVAFDGIRNIMDAFGASDADMQFFDDLVGGFNKVSQGAQQGAMAVVSFMSGDIFGGIMGAIGSIGNIISGFTDIFYAGRVRRANREIESQQKLLDSLEHSYERLQKAADQLFSSEYIANFAKQQRNLQAQISATQKQLAAERSKGKKADNDKIKQYEEQIQSLKDELEDMQGKLAEHMLGTDLASAARSFAQAWLDAYKEFGDVRKAIEGEMQKLMENLIVESVLGAVMQRALKPVFDMINEMGTSDFYDDSFWTEVVDKMTESTDNALTGANVIMKKLEAAGVDIRELGSDFTGISKDIATASEESINGLATGVSTSLFYVSNIDRNVAQIVAIMTGGGYEVASGEQLTDLITIQNQHLSYLPSIALYTSQTAERCERAAAACENIAENLNRVIKPNGVQGSYKVNTSL